MSDPSAVPALPPYYAQPVALDATRHAAWRLLPGDAAFAADGPSVPIGVSEFAAAQRAFPILFTAGDVMPVALMGVERANLFVESGQWAEGAYLPAYVRRYPFVLIEASDKQSFALGVDAASDRIAREGSDGAALFDPHGQPAEITRQALEFCRLFNLDHARTQAFCEALGEAGLLVERRADIELPGGRKLGLGGFKVVDPERFLALADDKVVDWHRKGWLALIAYHLASLDRFQTLLGRQAQRDSAQALRSAMTDPQPPSTPEPQSKGRASRASVN